MLGEFHRLKNASPAPTTSPLPSNDSTCYIPSDAHLASGLPRWRSFAAVEPSSCSASSAAALIGARPILASPPVIATAAERQAPTRRSPWPRPQKAKLAAAPNLAPPAKRTGDAERVDTVIGAGALAIGWGRLWAGQHSATVPHAGCSRSAGRFPNPTLPNESPRYAAGVELDWQALSVVVVIAAAIIAYRASIRAVEVSAEKGLQQWKLQSDQERERWAWEAEQARLAWQREEDRRHRQAGEDAARKVRDLLLAAAELFDHRHETDRRARWKAAPSRIRHYGPAGPEREELDPLLAPIPSLSVELPDAVLREFVRQVTVVLEQWQPAYEQLRENLNLATFGVRIEGAVQAHLGAFIRGEPTERDEDDWIEQAHDAVEEWWDLHADPD